MIITDGPYAWYQHLSRVLEGRGYQRSRAGPCLFQLFDQDKQKLIGIIALATDDMLHGGEAAHWEHMEWLRSQYKMGKYTTGNGKFTGKTIEQQPSGAILLHQKTYIEEKVNMIPMKRERKRQRYSTCSATEVNQLRTLLGALAWVAKETRPDVAGRVALLQQSMPLPMIKDIIEANAVAEEKKKDPAGSGDIDTADPYGTTSSRSCHRCQLGKCRRQLHGREQQGLLGRDGIQLGTTSHSAEKTALPSWCCTSWT